MPTVQGRAKDTSTLARISVSTVRARAACDARDNEREKLRCGCYTGRAFFYYFCALKQARPHDRNLPATQVRGTVRKCMLDRK